MNRVNLVVLWHMHQPQYRDPESGRVCAAVDAAARDQGLFRNGESAARSFPNFMRRLTWCRRWGCSWKNMPAENSMSRGLRWRSKTRKTLTREDKTEILARAFQVNHERLMSRWKRFVELFEWSRPAAGRRRWCRLPRGTGGICRCCRNWRGWRKTWFRKMKWSAGWRRKGGISSETDQNALKEKTLELIADGAAGVSERGARAGRLSSARRLFITRFCRWFAIRILRGWRIPATPLPRRAYRRPEDAREQLRRAREYHERVFGVAAGGIVAVGRIGVGSGDGDCVGRRIPVVWDG